MYGTGWLGSLTYSSNAAPAAGFERDSLPSASKYSVAGWRFLGGHESRRLNSFTPVTNIQASGSFAGLSFRYSMKNGNWMFSRKNSPVLMAKSRLPSVRPAPRVHPPWDHGPITSMLGVPAFFSSIAW